jgi:hypothetical protein
MPNLTIEMTDAELFALDLIAVDKQDWADNVLTDRARVAKEELKSDPNWMQAAVALVGDGGDATDDWAVLLKGKELGLFKTAKEIAELQEVAGPDQPVTAETKPTDIALNRVQFKSMLAILGISIDQINAAIDDGVPDPTQNAIAKVKVAESERYNRSDPLFNLVGPALNLTVKQIDAAWEQALKI